jgi:predicted MPP superfamily phosphohydrolase
MINRFFGGVSEKISPNTLRSILFKRGSRILAVLLGYQKRARKNANQLLYRTEPVNLPDIPAALRGVRLLFLTDPHIGGTIDTRATQISREIQTLLAGGTPEKTIILHGGDFVCESGGTDMTTEKTFLDITSQLFGGLSAYPQFSVVGNHDHKHPAFDIFRKHLEEEHRITFLEKPEDMQIITLDRAKIAVHGIHTLAIRLHEYPKKERDTLMDATIDALNAPGSDCNVVLLHNPDGLEFLLQRLHITHKRINKSTIFLAGHTHGAMFDVPVLRQLGLLGCRT